jgi:FSR family fosmidomycin resistance protein-like MFS transporter
MFKQSLSKNSTFLNGLLRGVISLTLLFLVIEFFDELNYGMDNAVRPALRTDLALTYAQVGLLLGLPHIIGSFIEPILMLLGDTRLRRRLMLGGGLAIALSLLTISVSHSFLPVLVAMIVCFPASGAFVTLSQATLMDLNPGREAQMMARWTVSGSVANLIGPLLIAGGFALGFGWRWSYASLAVLCLGLVAITWRQHIPNHPRVEKEGTSTPGDLLRGVWDAVRNPGLVRWLLLLDFSDLLLDVLTGYLPLYFADVSGFTDVQVGLVLSVLMLAGLVSNIALIPLLERFPGRTVVRLSAAATLVLYPLWLLVPWAWAKIGLIILLKLVTLGWYEVLQGEAYAALPGRSGTVMALNSLTGVLAGGLSYAIGWVAAQAGLPAAMWLLLAGPLILIVFVPRARKRRFVTQENE